MCGIVGIGDFSKFGIGIPELNAFQQMLIIDTARGLDGTGIIKVLQNGKSDTRKCAGNPFDLFRTGNVQERFIAPILKKQSAAWLVGHNRAATKGEISDVTAHPFTHGHITLVHNGTTTAACSLPEIKDFAVDSEAICKAISLRGIEDVIKSGSIGPFCLVFYDAHQKTMNFVRNHGRPMFIGTNENQYRMVFASERGAIELICDRQQWHLDIKALPEYMLVSYPLDEMKPKIKDVDPWKGRGYRSGMNSEWEWVGGVYRKKQKTLPETTAGSPSTPTTRTGSQVVNYTSQKSTRFQRRAAVHQYHVDDHIYFEVVDYSNIPGNDDLVSIVGKLTAFPDIRVKATVKKDVELDDLITSSIVKATIVQLVEDTEYKNFTGAPQYTIFTVGLEVVGVASKPSTTVTQAQQADQNDIDDTIAELVLETQQAGQVH